MPSHSYLIQFFQNSGKFNAIRAAEISEQFEERTFDKNEIFLKEGLVSNEYLILEAGMMRAFVHDVEGNEVTTGFFNDHQVVFEVTSFFMRIPSRENIQALTSCKGWVISFEKLNGLFHALPEFREFGRGVLVKCFAAHKLRTVSMITETAEQRYAALINSNPEIFQYAPLKYIASYLGITDTSLSRIRKEMARK
jgi:CRP-like cAMP-binding protein